MITLQFIFLSTNGVAPERVTASMNAIPSKDELVMLGGQLYRVIEVTHVIEDQSIEVRCVA